MKARLQRKNLCISWWKLLERGCLGGSYMHVCGSGSTWIRIIFGIWILIHIRVKIWIRIRITFKSKFGSLRGSKELWTLTMEAWRLKMKPVGSIDHAVADSHNWWEAGAGSGSGSATLVICVCETVVQWSKIPLWCGHNRTSPSLYKDKVSLYSSSIPFV